jgi:hypothetical protein
MDVHDRVRARPLQMAQQARGADAIHARHGRRPGTDARRELVGEPHRPGVNRRMPQNIASELRTKARRQEADEVVQHLDLRALGREGPGHRFRGAGVAGAVRRGEDQDAGRGSATGRPGAHVPKRRSRCW